MGTLHFMLTQYIHDVMGQMCQAFRSSRSKTFEGSPSLSVSSERISEAFSSVRKKDNSMSGGKSMIEQRIKHYLSAKELAQILGLSENWIQRISSPGWPKEHRLPCHYFFSAKKFLISEAEEFFKKRCQEKT